MNTQKKIETRQTSWRRHETRAAARKKSEKLLGRAKLRLKIALEVFQTGPEEVENLDFRMF